MFLIKKIVKYFRGFTDFIFYFCRFAVFSYQAGRRSALSTDVFETRLGRFVNFYYYGKYLLWRQDREEVLRPVC